MFLAKTLNNYAWTLLMDHRDQDSAAGDSETQNGSSVDSSRILTREHAQTNNPPTNINVNSKKLM